MGFIYKFIAKIALNGVTLYAIQLYFPGFVLTGGLEPLVIGAFVLAFLNTFVRPVLRLVATPFIWLTFGLFHIVIHVILLWFADKLLTQLTITDIPTLFWTSLILALVNIFF
ncbi:MAG: hypothetical protein A3C07_00685 [Candidatus Sungbacteria bacterium RIFCSPHIGHO2_02_FULL_47_11]|uniref:Phage holin family protein n=1 Tax=Candidatus Sungbacteria bacterium RIFCSPHIGHO2_02_FULL_47_11 TaxID=1802270 RepID=A0A1G2KNS9_9BACT|nr:MAG: hypothetical protein A3C07_00685 [Candidatus Sungbacteria bacterium RIFCSPHIGHO2_02_FULL_47_11]